MNKDSFRIFASAFLIVSGIGIAIAGFCVPPVGEVSDSVLMLVAECFIVAGAFVGIDVLIDKKIVEAMKK